MHLRLILRNQSISLEIFFRQLHYQYKKLMYIFFSIHIYLSEKSHHKGIEIKCYFSFCHMKKNIKCNPLFSAVAFVLEFKYEAVDPNLIICKKMFPFEIEYSIDLSSYSRPWISEFIYDMVTLF